MNPQPIERTPINDIHACRNIDDLKYGIAEQIVAASRSAQNWRWDETHILPLGSGVIIPNGSKYRGVGWRGQLSVGGLGTLVILALVDIREDGIKIMFNPEMEACVRECNSAKELTNALAKASFGNAISAEKLLKDCALMAFEHLSSGYLAEVVEESCRSNMDVLELPPQIIFQTVARMPRWRQNLPQLLFIAETSRDSEELKDVANMIITDETVANMGWSPGEVGKNTVVTKLHDLVNTLVCNQILPFETVEKIVKRLPQFAQIQTLLCRRPDATEAALAYWAEHGDIFVQQAVGENCNTNMEVLLKLAQSSHSLVLGSVVESGRLPDDVLDRLGRSEEEIVRSRVARVAQNQQTLKRLASDSSNEVRLEVMRNPKAELAIINSVAAGDNPHGLSMCYALADRLEDPDLLRRLAVNGEFTKECADLIITNPYCPDDAKTFLVLKRGSLESEGDEY